MNSPPFGIIVSSQKGGVGKTTITSNLAVALQQEGYSILIIDADYTNPAIAFHLGLPSTGSKKLMDYKRGTKLKNILQVHQPTGVHVITARHSGRPAALLPSAINVYKAVMIGDYDFIIVDTPPGFFPVAVWKYFGRRLPNIYAFIVTVPFLPSYASASKLAKLYDSVHIKHGLVVNRIKGKRFEQSVGDIVSTVGDELAAQLPEDDAVEIGVSEHIPAYLLQRRAPFSRGIARLAQRCIQISGRSGAGKVQEGRRGSWLRELFKRLFGG